MYSSNIFFQFVDNFHSNEKGHFRRRSATPNPATTNNSPCRGRQNKNKYQMTYDNPYDSEWAKKILYDKYNCLVVENDNKLKLVKASTK